MRKCEEFVDVEIGCESYDAGTAYNLIDENTSIAANTEDRYRYILPEIVDSYYNPVYNKPFVVKHT